ncbi:hypothetical protein B4064_0221 [Caldibacillus thermoamylovorans]|nr:hypothetical protein B4064_0221 [Caldibacillus thermoamylovorans]
MNKTVNIINFQFKKKLVRKCFCEKIKKHSHFVHTPFTN